MLDCCIAIAFWVNWKFPFPPQPFSTETIISDSLLSVSLVWLAKFCVMLAV
ncbi:hypothetical protein [Nostoc sp.]|uniref:hypothetical protein n=1 Tax=Nostoc sp. TaxID=1180 RepID=UPI002FF5E4DC